MDEPLSRSAIEELDRLELCLGTGTGCVRLLERGPQRGALGAIAHRCGARLSHVLLGGSNIGHRILVIEYRNAHTAVRGARILEANVVDVKA
jgi:hypothetical protein